MLVLLEIKIVSFACKVFFGFSNFLKEKRLFICMRKKTFQILLACKQVS